jgi:hypothetical protein
MMKKMILFAALGVAALFASHNARAAERVKLPPEMLGTWCLKNQQENINPKDDLFYVRENCRGKTDSWIVIAPDGYEGHEMGCTTAKSTRRKDAARSDTYTTRYRYVMQYKCGGEGMTWFASEEMYLDEDDTLVVTKRRSWGEKNEG